jgi:hypothetical protein
MREGYDAKRRLKGTTMGKTHQQDENGRLSQENHHGLLKSGWSQQKQHSTVGETGNLVIRCFEF